MLKVVKQLKVLLLFIEKCWNFSNFAKAHATNQSFSRRRLWIQHFKQTGKYTFFLGYLECCVINLTTFVKQGSQTLLESDSDVEMPSPPMQPETEKCESNDPGTAAANNKATGDIHSDTSDSEWIIEIWICFISWFIWITLVIGHSEVCLSKFVC